MADITWDDVTAVASQLSTYDTDAQTVILAVVNGTLDPAPFGGESADRYALARMYLAAHIATASLQGQGGVVGPVTQETVDQISRSYAAPSGAVEFDSLGSTAYGKLYRMLVRSTYARVPVVL